jgi:DNA-binding NarL/FixJ family response regulator
LDKIRVFLSDWQVLFREGIHFTLSGEEDMVVTGETTGNEDALELITKNPPDIAIINVDYSEFTGLKLTRRIRQDLPLVSVVLVMDTDNEEQLHSALKSGAAACISKDIDPEELINLIRQIAGRAEPINRSILNPAIASRIIVDFESFNSMNREVDNLLASLTSREIDILRRIVNGEKVENIASSLGITSESIDVCLGVIKNKLERNELSRDIVEAAQKGLSAVINRTRRRKGSEEYITKAEFETFRDSLMDHFRSFTGH